MVSRSISKPTNSEELMVLDEYMVYVNTTFLYEMTQTVKELSIVACNISHYTVLSSDFWLIHASAIKCIKNITPVFKKYAIIFETRKSIVENTLTNFINKFNCDLDAFALNLKLLDRIIDVNKLYEHTLVIIINIIFILI